ncbi:MAG: hypothetical protein ACLUE2_01750 [Bacteroides cellulosilyticus]
MNLWLTDRNKLNFSLIGDPALTLAYPDYQVQVDEFAGSECGRRNERLSAGESR